MPASCRRPRPRRRPRPHALANRGAALRPRRPAAGAPGLAWVPAVWDSHDAAAVPTHAAEAGLLAQRVLAARAGPSPERVSSSVPLPAAVCAVMCPRVCIHLPCVLCCKYRLDSLYSIYYHNYELKVTVGVTLGDLRGTTKHLLSAGYCNKRWGAHWWPQSAGPRSVLATGRQTLSKLPFNRHVKLQVLELLQRKRTHSIM